MTTLSKGKLGVRASDETQDFTNPEAFGLPSMGKAKMGILYPVLGIFRVSYFQKYILA